MGSFRRKDKSLAALAIANASNEKYNELANTTVGDLAVRVEDLENVMDAAVLLINDISKLRTEISNAKNQNLSILQNVQSMFDEINIKTISNEKTALLIQTTSTRLSIEIANSGIII